MQLLYLTWLNVVKGFFLVFPVVFQSFQCCTVIRSKPLFKEGSRFWICLRLSEVDLGFKLNNSLLQLPQHLFGHHIVSDVSGNIMNVSWIMASAPDVSSAQSVLE